MTMPNGASRSRVQDIVEDDSWHGAGDPLQDLAAFEEEDRRNRPDAVPVRKPGGSSTFTLARITRPPEFAARSSRAGAIAWHGAHQSAEKSTMSSPSLAATTSSKGFSVRCIGAVRFDRFTIVWFLLYFQMSTDASRVPDAQRNEAIEKSGAPLSIRRTGSAWRQGTSLSDSQFRRGCRDISVVTYRSRLDAMHRGAGPCRRSTSGGGVRRRVTGTSRPSGAP